MNEKKRIFGRLLFVICFAIAFYLFLSRIDVVFNAVKSIAKILSPVIVGLIIAFIVNIPMSFVEKIIYKLCPNKKERVKGRIVEKEPTRLKAKVVRVISIIITIVAVLLFIRGLIIFIIPQLAQTINSIIEKLPVYYEDFKSFAYSMQDKLNVPEETAQRMIMSVTKFLDQFTKNITNFIPTILKATQNITTGVFDFVMSIIIAIYMLSGKEGLSRMFKKITFALCSKKSAERVIKVTALANKTFTAFARGQILEAFVIGFLCYLGMVIFKMEYALLISVIIGISALVPIFGAFIGGAVGAVLLFTIAPIKGVWFVVFIVVLQQLENNFIYPKVVGTSIGISGLWVMIALIIGGALGGIPGILIGIPVFAAIYELFGEFVSQKLKEKEIEIK
ncbi:MAG: AI-2E family transporter [Clostridia bacterium]